MALSIPDIARDHREFIATKLTEYAQRLHPSSAEDEELIRRAVFTVRNRSVIFERFIPFSSTLYTVVQDVRSAEVIIDFKRETISCTCPTPDICRHEIGVLLALYQYFGSVQEWKAKWQAQKTVQLHTLAEQRSPENWQRMVQEVVEQTLKPYKRLEDYMIPSLVETIRTKLRRYLPFEREWQPLFNLFMELATLLLLWNHLTKTNALKFSSYFPYHLDRTTNRMEELIYESKTGIRLFETDVFYDALQQMILELVLLDSEHIQTRFNLYLTIWKQLFLGKQRSEKELALLQGQEMNATVYALQLFHTIRNEQDALFTETLAQATSDNIELLISIADFAHQARKESKVHAILLHILPYLETFLQQSVPPMERQQTTFYLSQLYKTVPLTEQQEIALYSAYGYYGVQPYSEYLLHQERYSEWVALHQLYPSSIAYLESCGLKTVIAQAPAVTLPLYHYYAMDEVAQKSRMNYKQAVRIWRSMKTAAKKSGNLTFWENYITAVRQQYKRLRALQEEIDKSNLLV